MEKKSLNVRKKNWCVKNDQKCKKKKSTPHKTKWGAYTEEDVYLDNVEQQRVWNGRKLDLMMRVSDGLQLGDVVFDVLERCATVHHVVEDTT